MSIERTFSLGVLADEALREAAMRRRVYAQRINTGRMTREQADLQIAKMDQIARVLRRASDAEAAKTDLFGIMGP